MTEGARFVGVRLALVLAQCAGPLEECDLSRTLPWYFGLAIGAAWLATVVGVVLLVRRRLLARRGRDGRRERRKELDAPKGRDVELW